jgi:hypothetical protein
MPSHAKTRERNPQGRLFLSLNHKKDKGNMRSKKEER